MGGTSLAESGDWALKLGSAAEIPRGVERVSHVSAYLIITERYFLLLESICWHETMTLVI